MSDIIYRLAKPDDAKRIADVHYSVRGRYDAGIFSRLGKPFLRRYYKIILNDPYEIVICAEKDGRILGFSSSTLDSQRQMSRLRKHKLSLAGSALPSIVKKPSLIAQLLQRYKATRADSDIRFVHTEGVRGEYWAWDPDVADPIAAVELDDVSHKVLYALGAEEVCFEVDAINKNVLKLHKLNKAEEMERIMLPDGRERVLLKYDLKAKYSKKECIR